MILTLSSQCILIINLIQAILCISAEATHCPSSGCTNGKSFELKSGESTTFDRNDGTQKRTHLISVPHSYVPGTPSPLLLYFHELGGNYTECGTRCKHDARKAGFITVSMSGYGNPGWGSWNDLSSPELKGSTCEPGATNYCSDYSNFGCNCRETFLDNCWCRDSVAQVVSILDEVEKDFCVDRDMIWAMGCGHGGMFTFELADDNRTAARLAGIVPIVGLPHYGSNFGPSSPMSMVGMWGIDDIATPPISNTNDANKTVGTINGTDDIAASPISNTNDANKTFDTINGDGVGWYYTSWQAVMAKWTNVLKCAGNGSDILTNEWNIGNYQSSLVNCTRGCDVGDDNVAVGCLFRDGVFRGGGGHICSRDFVWDPVLTFMLDHPKAETMCLFSESNNTKTSTSPHISVQKASYIRGEEIVVTFSNNDATKYDWVAVFPSGCNVLSDQNIAFWLWTCNRGMGDGRCVSPKGAGSLTFGPNPPDETWHQSWPLHSGSYKACLFSNLEEPYIPIAQTEKFMVLGPSLVMSPSNTGCHNWAETSVRQNLSVILGSFASFFLLKSLIRIINNTLTEYELMR